MPALDHARLTITADPDGDGNQETGVFTLAGNLEEEQTIRTGFIGKSESGINAVISNLVRDYGELEDELSPEQRKAVALDLGGGEHAVQIQFKGWEGAYLDGEPVQWGNDPDPSRTMATATGEPPMTQMEVLSRYVTAGEIDSRSPAILEYGEHHAGGLYEPLDVLLEQPQTRRTYEEPTTFTGSLTLISTQNVNTYLDALARGKR